MRDDKRVEKGGREMSDGWKERARARSSEQGRDVSLTQSKHIHANVKVFAKKKNCFERKRRCPPESAKAEVEA